MAQGRATSAAHSQAGSSRLSQLWQVPLFLLSLGLFGYAAYLFIDPHLGPTIEQRLQSARTYLAQERPQAAIDLLDALLDKETLTSAQQGQIHLMLAESLELGQQQQHRKIPANYASIVEQTHLAMAAGVVPDAQIYRRLGESYEGLNRPVEALDDYRHALALDKEHALHLRRKSHRTPTRPRTMSDRPMTPLMNTCRTRRSHRASDRGRWASGRNCSSTPENSPMPACCSIRRLNSRPIPHRWRR